MTIELELVRLAADTLPAPAAASPGVPVSEADLPHGPTILTLLDLPLDLPLGGGAGGKPLLFAAAAGSERGWRRAALETSFDGGGSWQAAGATALPAVIGAALGSLPPAGPALIDTVSSVEVELAHGAMWLEGRSDDALVSGANLALLGGELIQFGAAESLGAARFRLSRLLRGRRGTEWAAGDHAGGERFVLIERETLVALEAPPGSVGSEARLLAHGIGDIPEAVLATVTIEGASLQPPGPVHLRAEEAAGGDLAIHWVRRSRQGWSWPSGGDTPLGEEAELYRMQLSGAGFARRLTTAQPYYLYTAAEQAEDGASRPLDIEVVQVGTFAPSRPARLRLS
jgi:hypothetical protein